MNLSHQKYFYFSLAFLFSGCVIMNEPEVKVVGPVAYSYQVSKKEIKYETDLVVPESTISIATLNYDATTQIVYTKNSVYKKHKGEYYFSSNSQVDTFKLAEPDSSYIPTDYFFSGNFKPPVSKPPHWNFEDRGIVFNSDGFCVSTRVSNCSDSPCYTTTQSKGVYRTADDTIYVTYSMTRSFLNGYDLSASNSIKSIDEVSWSVREPTSVNYFLTTTNDTLYNVSLGNYPKTAYYLIDSDSLIRIQKR